jgi:hypothetical protein
MGLDHSRHQNHRVGDICRRIHNTSAPKKYRPKMKSKKHTTAGIRWWSPTQLLICRSEAYVWQSGRDAQCIFSLWSYVLAKRLISIIYGTNNRSFPPSLAQRPSSILWVGVKTILWERGVNRSILACDRDTGVVKNEFGSQTLSKRSCYPPNHVRISDWQDQQQVFLSL